MSAKSPVLLLVAALTVGGVAIGGGVRRYHARPQERCGIPAADYQPPHPPPVVRPVVAVSKVGVLLAQPQPQPTTAADAAMSLQIPTTATAVARVKAYQFVPTSLAIDHCSISRMTLSIDDHGAWRFNFQADQNPQVTLPAAAVAVPTTAQIRGMPDVRIKQTEHLKRNLFVVRLRGYGAYSEPLPTPPAPSNQGKPALVALPPVEFWVQRGVPYQGVFEGANANAATFFDQIDRFELEFSYR